MEFILYSGCELLENANNRTRIGSTASPILFLVLSIFGFGFINYILMQIDINKYALAMNRPQYPQYPQYPQQPMGPTM